MTPSKDRADFWDGNVPWVSAKDMKRAVLDSSEDYVTDLALKSTGLKLQPVDSVLVVTRGMILAHTFPVARNAVPVTINQDMKALQPRAGVSARYLAWMLEGLQPLMLSLTEESAHGTKALRTDQWANQAVPVPTPSLQESIANFLDQKTMRMDALIAEKSTLVGRLEELQAAEIAAHVLGHTLPGGRQQTRTPEIGSIPSHWMLSPMMRLTDPTRPIMYGIVLPGPNIEEGPSVPIVKGGDVRPHRLKLELLNRTTPEIEAPYARARLATNDIVYSIRGTIGDAELVPKELAGANITQDAARIAPRAGIEPRWLLYAAKSAPFFAQLEQLSLGAAVRGINIFDLKRARVPTPPFEEQEQIAANLDRLTLSIKLLRQHAIDHIARLQEYRASLISATVTGAFDINSIYGMA